MSSGVNFYSFHVFWSKYQNVSGQPDEKLTFEASPPFWAENPSTVRPIQKNKTWHVYIAQWHFESEEALFAMSQPFISARNIIHRYQRSKKIAGRRLVSLYLRGKCALQLLSTLIRSAFSYVDESFSFTLWKLLIMICFCRRRWL